MKKKETSPKKAGKLKHILKKLFDPKGSRHGSMAASTIALTIILVLVVNLVLGALDSTVFDLDISDQSLYEISDVSAEYLKGLEEDIDVIVIAVEDEVDRRISKFIDRYSELSDRIHVSYVNPVTTPSILETYECASDVVVVKNHETGKYTVIPLRGQSNGAFIVEVLDYNTYSYKEAYFDGEGLMTGAVEFVTSNVTNTIYCLTGHDEVPLSETLVNTIRKANITIGEDLDILMTGGIPDDCDTLIINDPSTDLSLEELDAINRFVKTGGNVIALMDEAELTNFNTLLSDYGLEMLKGTLGDRSRFYSQFYNSYGYICAAPVLSMDSMLTDDLAESGGNSMVLYAAACKVMEEPPKMMSFDSFMTTSADGVLYVPAETEGGDVSEISGTFTEAITTTVILENAIADNTATFTLFSCPALIDSSITDAFPSFLNLDIFMTVMKAHLEDVSEFNIYAKSLETTFVTVENPQVYMIMFTAVLPVAIFLFGLVLWIKRRKL